MKIKYLILDFGMVLAYPTTGQWFITPKFLELIDINKINKLALKGAMEKYDYIISKKVTTLDEEYDMFYEFYTNILKEVNYTEYSDSILDKIAYNITYEDDKYKFYANIKEELNELSKKYKLILLSDNWPCVIRIMKNVGIYNYFEKVYVSSIYGVEKKDKVFFDYPIKDFNIKNGEAIFVDDNEQLLDIALEKGFIVKLMNRENEKLKSKYQSINNLYEL